MADPIIDDINSDNQLIYIASLICDKLDNMDSKNVYNKSHDFQYVFHLKDKWKELFLKIHK